jgi:hypothetical protein
MDGFRKRTVTACSEAGVEAAASSMAGDKAVKCSKARIKDGRWRQHRQ